MTPDIQNKPLAIQEPEEEIYDTGLLKHPYKEELVALWKYRELARQMVERSIKTRYKRSFLGVFWTMLNPLLTMLVLTAVFSSIFRFQVPHYAVYVLSGLMCWNFFTFSTVQSMSDMLSNGDLLRRIFVPKSIFAISATSTASVNTALTIIPLFIVMGITGAPFGLSLLALPVALVILMFFAVGIGLILAAISAYFADIVPMYEVLLVIMMYATPIIYPKEIVPENIQWIFKFNPMAYIVDLFHTIIYGAKFPSMESWLIAACIAVFTLVAGWFIFTSRARDYAYRS